MPNIKKSKKSKSDDDRKINDFNDFCLAQKDYHGESFFILNGTQIVQNYKCQLSYEDIVTRFRNQK